MSFNSFSKTSEDLSKDKGKSEQQAAPGAADAQRPLDQQKKQPTGAAGSKTA